MHRRDGDQYLVVKVLQGTVHQILGRHHDAWIEVFDRQAANLPEIGGGRPWQHGLDPDAFFRKLLVQRLGKGGDIRLAATVHAVEQLRRQADNGRDVDQGTLPARDESWDGRVGKAGEGGDVESDHFSHALDITIQQAGVSAYARVVHQQADAGAPIAK